MGKDRVLNILLAVGCLFAGVALTRFLADDFDVEDTLFQGFMLLTAVSTTLYVAVLVFWREKKGATAVKDESDGFVGINLDGAIGGKISESGHLGRGTFIRARRSEGLKIERNRAVGPEVFADLDDAKNPSVIDNDYIAPDAIKPPKAPSKKFYAGWRPNKTSDT